MEDKSELIPSTTKIGLSTENELPFCGVCSVQFPSKESFDTHYEQNHLVEKLRCENCNKAFSSKFLFEKHSKKHNCKMKNKMASCDFGDLQISVGNKIIDRKRSTVEKSFECGVCKKSFSSNSNLLNHIQKHNGDKKYVCHICQKKFMQNVYLKRHLRTHTGERPYTCEECFRCFAKRAQLNIHSRIHTGEMPYSCDICSKKFRHVGSLKYHSFFVHTEAGRLQLLSCNVCGTRFKEKRALLRHELRHKTISNPSPSQINNSPVDCIQDDIKPACVSKEELCRFQDNLKPQADIHPEHKPYVCHTCQQCFPNEKSFQEHSDAHTNKVIPVISSSFSYDINSGGENLQLDYHNRAEEKFICNICDEQFDNSDGLKIHFKIHTEQKYSVCEVCQLCFFDEDALRNHQNIEKCVYFHTCKLCGEKFVDKKELEVHCKTHEHFANETTFPDSLKKLNHLVQHCTTPSNASVESNVLERSWSFNDNRIEKDCSSVNDFPSNCESNKKLYH
ncbi:Zinc finger protein 227 like protein [Argiope bruennichi]|uniref:Zinc finger protein 227 like protein n=1 Tax=Argiope bruennichi TaxID=94029 RepID=A0A8T0EVY4_ARGBR|nr:Zinc finger protein 227 like protein [Argiope bruennichi]